MEGFTLGAIVASVVAGAVLMVVAALLKRYEPKWLGWDWAEIVPYALRMTASVAVIVGVVVLLLISAPRSELPVAIEDRVSQWLTERGITEIPLSVPANGSEIFHTNFLYGNFTMNVIRRRNDPDFLIALASQPLSDTQSEWWGNLSSQERNSILLELQQSVGIDPNIGFGIEDVQMGNSRSRIFQVQNRIPIDAGLTRPWFFSEIETVSRYFRNLEPRFIGIFENRNSSADDP